MFFFRHKSGFIVLCYLFVFFTSTVLLCLYIIKLENCQCPDGVTSIKKTTADFHKSNDHGLALLVPFRDRFDELLTFIPLMEKFLNNQKVQHQFFVLNQIDDYRFNRGSLINVGFKLIKDTFQYFAIHDIDLLPLNDELKYHYRNLGVFHVSSPQLHPKYNYPTFLGGILLVRNEDYLKVNGMSNRYWGWGLEDDEFYTRLSDKKIPIFRPENISTNNSNTFLHNHDKYRRRRDMQKCYNQRNVTRKRDRLTGLHDVKFQVKSTVSLTIDSVQLKVVNIMLECDRALTPWCQCENPPASNSMKKVKPSNLKQHRLAET